MTIREGAEERARKVRALLLDADGVLTDGRLLIGPDGSEWKAFDTRDGLGIRIAQQAGLTFGIVSGRRSSALERRASELNIVEVHQAVSDKGRVFDAVVRRLGLEPDQVLFAGDDLVDVPAMRRAGLAVTVPSACEDVRRFAHVVTARGGGAGAVREMVELVLRAQARWDAVLDRYDARGS